MFKNNLKLRNIFLLAIMTMSSLGFILIMLLSNIYMLDKSELFKKETWITNPNDVIIDSSEITFSDQELEDVQISLTKQSLFYYEQLSKEEKDVFDFIYLNIKNRKEKIEFEEPISINFLTKIVYILKFDCPEFYFLGDSFDYDVKGKKAVAYYPEYIISTKKYEKMQKEVDKIVEEIKILVEGKTEYEAELIIHNYIVQNCLYTIETTNCNNLYGCLIEGKANCEGYSSAFMYLLRQVGIEATQVIGEINYNNEIIGHSWNLVKIDGEYYYTDVCWNDLENTPEYENIGYHYAFFNITYKEMENHRDTSKNIEYLGTIPEATATKLNYYKKSNLFASSVDDAEKIIEERLPSVISSNDSFLVIKCNGKEVYDELLENITDIMQKTINENKLAITKCKYAKIQNGYTLIIHSFSYSK